MNTAIILAAGTSSRFGRPPKDKLLLPVLGKPLIYYPIQVLHDHPQVGQVIIAASPANKKAIQGIVKKYRFPRVKKIVTGGRQRQQSLYAAFKHILGADKKDIVIVHNGANPLVTAKEISAVISAARKNKAAAVGKKITDTIKEIRQGHLVKTHQRERLIAAQTPQAAQYEILKKALQKAMKQRKIFTDESSLVGNLGLRVKHVAASPENFKITTLIDYEHLKVIMGDTPKNFLVGIGQDSHEFSATQKGLYLGGVLLKNRHKLQADSDGDVILHALFNAISQALGEGSLGRIATPMKKEKGITRSRKYLEPLLARIQKRGYVLNNVGLMLEAKIPRIDPIANKLKESIAGIVKIPSRRIGITATSGENLSPFGRGEGMQCFAIVSLKKHAD